MTKIATLKAQAANLRASLAKSGVALTQAQALEAVAGQYGFDTWDALAGSLNQKTVTTPPLLSDMSAYPAGVWVEEGPGTTYYVVDHCDMGAIECLHDEEQLKEYLDGASLQVSLITARSDGGEEVKFSAEELLDAEYEKLGGVDYWRLADGRFVRFDTGGLWKPKPKVVQGPPVLTVPQMVKSAKGCQLVVLKSTDGGDYDRYVVVPAHLKAQAIADKLDAELKRLKARDQGLPEDQEYTSDDLKTFVVTLGCTWVDEPVSPRETWD